MDPVVSECEDGDIRLVGGPTVLEGRVQVCLSNVWGAVCNNISNITTIIEDQKAFSKVVCSQLGFQSASQFN